MNKDALLATLIGFGIGLFITGILLAGPSLAKSLPRIAIPMPNLDFLKSVNAPKTTPSPTPVAFAVTITSPLPESIQDTASILVSGNTVPGATVLIQGNEDDAVSMTKEDGKYAGKVTLSEGKNDITVTSYLKEAQTTTAVTVYYTPESL